MPNAFQPATNLANFQAAIANTPAPGAAPPTPTQPVQTQPSTTPGTIAPPSQTQSTDVTTLGKPTLSSSQLPQPSPYTPSPVPDLSTITAQGNVPTASQGQYNDITSQIGQLTGQLSGQTDFANNLQTQYNVPQLTSTANDITSNISQIQNQRDAVQQQLKNQYGNDASKGYLSFEQQSVDSVLAAKQSAYASTLATINGQLSTAKAYIETAVANKYTPIVNQINALKSQADLVSNTLTREQTKQLAVMQAQLTDRANTVASNKAISSIMLEKIATAAANPGNPAPSYIVTQAQNAALGDDPASALAIIAPYLNNPLAAKQEIADINAKNASAAASYASARNQNAQAALLNPDASGVQASQPVQTTQAVAVGDTFTTLASAHGTTAEAIAAANPSVNPNNLQVGQRLTIPPTIASNALAQTPTVTGVARYSGNNPTLVDAQSVVDGLTLPSQYSKRGNAYNAFMSQIQQLSQAQTGHGYDAIGAQTAYAFRSKIFTPYVAKMPTAVSTISAIADLAKQANVSNLSDLTNVVNTGRAAGFFATAAQQSAAKQLQSKLALNSDDLGLLLGAGQGSDSKIALASVIFNPNGGVKSTNDLANSVATTLEHKTADYATQAGIQNPQVYAHNLVQNAFTRGQQPDNNYSNGGGQSVTSNGQQYIVGQVYNDGTANWKVDAQGNWTKQ